MKERLVSRRLSRHRLAAGLLAISVSVFTAMPAARADGDAEQSLYGRALRSAVWIVMSEGAKIDQFAVSPGGVSVKYRVKLGEGSGSIIDLKRRLVITNAHVVGDIPEGTVFFPTYQGKTLFNEQDLHFQPSLRCRGKVVAKDPTRDLAVVRLDMIPKGMQALPLAAVGPERGMRIHSIGNPGAIKKMWVFRTGKVLNNSHERFAAKDTDSKKPEQTIDCRVVTTDLLNQAGESGSPLFSDRGEMVGVVAAVSKDPPRSYSIEVGEVKSFLEAKRLTPQPDPPRALPQPPVARNSPAAPAAAPADTPAQRAGKLLKLAIMLEEGGVKDKARERFREIVRDFPGTKAADEARERLQEIDR
jgi:S1-C subfamily serine protease